MYGVRMVVTWIAGYEDEWGDDDDVAGGGGDDDDDVDVWLRCLRRFADVLMMTTLPLMVMMTDARRQGQTPSGAGRQDEKHSPADVQLSVL